MPSSEIRHYEGTAPRAGSGSHANPGTGRPLLWADPFANGGSVRVGVGDKNIGGGSMQARVAVPFANCPAGDWVLHSRIRVITSPNRVPSIQADLGRSKPQKNAFPIPSSRPAILPSLSRRGYRHAGELKIFNQPNSNTSTSWRLRVATPCSESDCKLQHCPPDFGDDLSPGRVARPMSADVAPRYSEWILPHRRHPPIWAYV
jgi:hypothetical protein